MQITHSRETMEKFQGNRGAVVYPKDALQPMRRQNWKEQQAGAR